MSDPVTVVSMDAFINVIANRTIDVEKILSITRWRKAYYRIVTTTTRLCAEFADRYARFATAFSIIFRDNQEDSRLFKMWQYTW